MAVATRSVGTPLLRAAVFGGLTLLSLTALWSCGAEPEPAGTRYHVKGIVRDASRLAESPRRLRIEHEAIDDFVGVDGSVEGMMSMTMEMTVWVAAEIPDGLAAGDRVRFELDVDWQRSPTALIVSVERLPAGAELTLEAG